MIYPEMYNINDIMTPYGWPEPDDDYDYELDDVDPDDYNFDPEYPLNNSTNEYDH